MTPPAPTRRRVALLAAALALGLLAVVGRSVWLGHTRPLHVVNALAAPVELEVNGVTYAVGAGERVALSLGEGQHRVTLRGPQGERQLEVDMQSGFLARLTTRPLFVLNLDGAAILLRQETVYGDAAVEAGPDRVLTDEVLALDRVDYAFAPFPDEAARKGLAVRVGWWRGAPADVAATLPPGDPQALDLLEGALRRDPTDVSSLQAWWQRVRDPERRRRVLEAELGRRPLLLAWHRRYQDLLRATGEHEALRQRYQALLAEAPDDSDRLYLWGRLAPRAGDALAIYGQAVANDPDHHAAWRGLAVLLAGLGRWDEAWEACLSADRDDEDLAELRYRIRLARGDARPLRDEVDAARDARPLDPNLLRRALELRVQAGEPEAARQLQRHYAQLVRARLPDDPQQLGRLSQLWLAELLGDGQALLDDSPALADPRRQAVFQLRGNALTGQLGPARALLGDAPDPWTLLELAVAAAAHGEDPAPWVAEATRAAQAGGPRERILAAALHGDEPLAQVIAPALERATLAAALHAQRPQSELRALALALVQRPAYPATLIREALD